MISQKVTIYTNRYHSNKDIFGGGNLFGGRGEGTFSGG